MENQWQKYKLHKLEIMLNLKVKFVNLARHARYIYWRYIKSRYYSSYNLFIDGRLEKLSNKKEFYFGYYNISPENKKGEIILCDLTDSDNGKISVFIKRKNGEIKIGETSAYNLQQGCMAQWGYSNDNLVYYNRYNKTSDKYECVIFDTQTMCEKDVLPVPIYSLSKQEDYALTLNFERLAEMRPDYGYFCRKNYNMPDNGHDGIWKIDLKTKEVSLIVSLQQLAEINPVPSMIGARHKVNHIDISPDGKRFMFLHRWIGPQGRFMRLITVDKDGNNLYVLNGDKMTSHSCWNGSDSIISFCYTDEYSEAYVKFMDQSKQKSLVSKKLPSFDGHPTISPNGKWIITDRYPGFNRFSQLYLYNIENDVCYTVGRFYQPLKYSRISRIDLHPKWNMKGNKVFFESGHNGRRCLYSITLTNLKNNE